MLERITNPYFLTAATVATVGAAALTGCGGESDSSNGEPSSVTVEVKTIYTDDGKRLTYIHKQRIPGGDFKANTILSYCDGPYLVDVMDNSNTSQGAGVTRTHAPKVCEDGELTPTDLPEHPEGS